jgi:O-antigen/teichoic acid export membrane protein
MLNRLIGYTRDPLYRNSFFIMLATFTSAILGFIFWILAAKLYSVNDVGEATGLVSSLGLIILFSRLGFDISLIRFYPIRDKGRVLFTSQIITTVGALLLSVLYIFSIEMIIPSWAIFRNATFFWTFILIAIFNSIANNFNNAFIAERRADYSFYQTIIMGLRIPFLIPLAFMGSVGILNTIGMAYLLGSIMVLPQLRRSISKVFLGIDLDFIRESFDLSSWSYISNILFAAPTFLLPIMVLHLLNDAEAAKYYLAFSIGGQLHQIPAALGTSLFVEGSHGEELKKNVIRAAISTFLFLIPGVVIIYVFAGYILGLLRPEYLDATDLLRVTALSSFPIAIYYIFVPIQNIRMKVRGIAGLNLVRCVFLLVLSYVFSLKYGITGIGYAWLITYIVVDLIIVLEARRERWI